MSEISESIIVESPYSVALDAIERRLESLKNKVRLTVPLNALGIPGPLALEVEVHVAASAVRGQKGQEQLHDEMKIQWSPATPGPYPTFDGTLEMHPDGTQTELILVGSYEPPLGIVGAAFDAVIGSKIAQVTAQALLGDLKTHLEADFATVRDTIEQTPPRE